MSNQLKDLVAELINQGYAFDDIKNEIDTQVAEREAEAKRIQEEAMAAQFQAQKEAAAEDLLGNVIDFLNNYYPEIMETLEFDKASLDGIGAELVKELDGSLETIAFMAKLYTPHTKKTVKVKAPKEEKVKIDPIGDFLRQFGLN